MRCDTKQAHQQIFDGTLATKILFIVFIYLFLNVQVEKYCNSLSDNFGIVENERIPWMLALIG